MDASPESRSFARSPHSLQVYTVRVLTPAGVRAQLNPKVSLYCSWMLNRVFGMILNGGWSIVPASVCEVFRIGEYIYACKKGVLFKLPLKRNSCFFFIKV